MNVQELFKRLSYGELSNLSMSSAGSGSIAADAQPKLITHANEGLLRLYSRFVLSEKEILLEMVDNFTNYHLLRRFAESNEAHDPIDPCYIKDVADPFLEDVIKVLEVYGEDGVRLPLNDIEDPLSVFTPNPIMLQIATPVPGKMLSLVYQARHVPLEYGVLGSEILLPAVLEGALVSYVAGQIYGNMNGVDNSAKGSEYMNKYEVICADILSKDLVNSSRSTSNTKFDNRGFV